MLKACESLSSQLAAAKTAEEIATVTKLAKEALAQVPRMAPTSKEEPDYAAFEAMSAEFATVANSSTGPTDIGATLHLAAHSATAAATIRVRTARPVAARQS